MTVATDQAVIWHDVECGSYREDLPLWRTLADACGGPVLDIGAGTGRVALDLAAHGHSVTAVDNDPRLLAALTGRAAAQGLTVETHCADARELEGLGGDYALVIVPMQTVQLLGGSAGRRAFLRAAKGLLRPGGLLAIAIADALSAFDGEADGLPSPDELIVGGVTYSSQTVALTEDDGQVTIHRIRSVGGSSDVEHDATCLDILGADELETEALMLGYRRRPRRSIPETDDHVGSTVVIAGV